MNVRSNKQIQRITGSLNCYGKFIYYNNPNYNYSKLENLIWRIKEILKDLKIHQENNHNVDIIVFDDVDNTEEDNKYIFKFKNLSTIKPSNFSLLIKYLLFILEINYNKYPFLVYHIEYKIRDNKDYLIHNIFNDYKYNLNNEIYSWMFNCKNKGIDSLITNCDMVQPRKKRLFIENQINPHVFPQFEIHLDILIIEFVLYVKIKIIQISELKFNGFISCIINEIRGNTNLKIEVVDGKGEHFYNCKGRIVKNKKNKEIDQLNFIEFNPNGEFPCYIVVREPLYFSYRKLNDPNISTFTKLLTLESLIYYKKEIVMLKLIKFVDFHTIPIIFLKPLCIYMFNLRTFDLIIKIRRNLKYESFVLATWINYAIGLYKEIYKLNGKRYHVLRKQLLKRICIYKKTQKIERFIKEYVINENNYYHVDFFLCCFKCILKWKLELTPSISSFILNGCKLFKSSFLPEKYTKFKIYLKMIQELKPLSPPKK